MTAKNPVAYAEKNLQVHDPWIEAQARLADHGAATERALNAKASMRMLKHDLSDRKAEILAEAPSVPGWPSSKTAQKEFVNLLVDADDAVKRFEAAITECQQVLDEANMEAEHHKIGLHVLTARMTELGGLLTFYAACKVQNTTTQPTHPYTEGTTPQ